MCQKDNESPIIPQSVAILGDNSLGRPGDISALDPWIVLYSVDGGRTIELDQVNLCREWDEISELEEQSRVHTDGNVDLRVISLNRALAANELCHAIKLLLKLDIRDNGEYSADAIGDYARDVLERVNRHA